MPILSNGGIKGMQKVIKSWDFKNIKQFQHNKHKTNDEIYSKQSTIRISAASSQVIVQTNNQVTVLTSTKIGEVFLQTCNVTNKVLKKNMKFA